LGGLGETDLLTKANAAALVVARQRSLTTHLLNVKDQIRNHNQKCAAAQGVKEVAVVECQVTLRFLNASILNWYCRRRKYWRTSL